MTRTWTNWARTATSTPALTITPRGTDHIVRAVERARETGHTVKPIGASHSFTGVGATDGIRLDMRRMRGLLDVDLERHRVTVAGGTHLSELSIMLDEIGFALPNMGDIDTQTITGATQTGTHGTGLGFGGLATGIVGLTAVTGTGEVVTATERDPDLLAAMALGLGALGVVVSVTLQCVPAYLLRAEERADTLDRVLDEYGARSREADHFEFYWFPHTRKARTKTNTRLPISAGADPLSRIGRWLDEEFVNNTLLGAVLEVEHRVPAIIPRVNGLISTVSATRTYSDRSHRVFVTNRRVRFTEMEFALPIEAIPDVVREIDAVVKHRGHRVSFPIEVRNAPADGLMLSTAHERASGYVAVHRFVRDDERAYFRDVQDIFLAYDGRPHWGKMHTLDAAYFTKAYPRFDDFLAVRDRCDPERIFANAYLTRVLGA